MSSVLDELSELRSPPAPAWLVLLLGFLVNAEAAFAGGLLTPLIAALLGALLSLESGKARSWLAATCFTLVFSSVAALPALALGEPVEIAALFIARAAGAAAAFTGVVASLGWYNLLLAFEQLRLPGFTSLQLATTLRMIPIFARDAARMLAAREARLLSRGKSRTWPVLASVVGDMLLLGYRRSKSLAMAIEARSLGARAGSSRSSASSAQARTPAGAILVTLTLLTTLAFVAGV